MKLNIEIRDGIPHGKALVKVATVMDGGFVSKSRGIPQHCFITMFEDGVVVHAKDRRTESSAHSFIVCREGKPVLTEAK